MKLLSGHGARLKLKMTAFLLAGVILAACSACGGQPSVGSLPVNTGATLPSIGAPEGEDLIPTSRASESGGDSTEAPGPSVPVSSAEATEPSGSSETETPSETAVPVIPTQPAQTEAPKEPVRPKAEIHALSAGQLADIRAKFDGTVNGFGTGFRHNWVDANNRPTMVNNLLARASPARTRNSSATAPT